MTPNVNSSLVIKACSVGRLPFHDPERWEEEDFLQGNLFDANIMIVVKRRGKVKDGFCLDAINGFVDLKLMRIDGVRLKSQRSFTSQKIIDKKNEAIMEWITIEPILATEMIRAECFEIAKRRGLFLQLKKHILLNRLFYSMEDLSSPVQCRLYKFYHLLNSELVTCWWRHSLLQNPPKNEKIVSRVDQE